MRILRTISSIAVSSMLLVAATRDAAAITLPDNSSCNTNSSNGCFKITNTNTNGQAIIGSGTTDGVVGITTTGDGVVGTATSGYAVRGAATSGTALAGSSGTGYGVYAVTEGTTAAVFGNNGSSTDGTGVFGQVVSTGTGSAIYGESSGSYTAWAASFDGDVQGRDFYGNSYNPSDLRLKNDVKNAPYGLKEVLKLRPVTFQWNEPEKHGRGVQVGLIAQEVQALIPEIVKSRGSDDKLAVNYTALIPVLVKAIQEQQKVIEEQGRTIAGLKPAASLSPTGTGMSVALAFGFLPVGLMVRRRLRTRRYKKD